MVIIAATFCSDSARVNSYRFNRACDDFYSFTPFCPCHVRVLLYGVIQHV